MGAKHRVSVLEPHGREIQECGLDHTFDVPSLQGKSPSLIPEELPEEASSLCARRRPDHVVAICL